MPTAATARLRSLGCPPDSDAAPLGGGEGREPKAKVNFPDIPNGPWPQHRPLQLSPVGGERITRR
jgi:hypothetical protein